MSLRFLRLLTDAGGKRGRGGIVALLYSVSRKEGGGGKACDAVPRAEKEGNASKTAFGMATRGEKKKCCAGRSSRPEKKPDRDSVRTS